jgi:5'(3')-deoxyribonucleotidase
MIIAFDVDDVIADLVPVWLARYNVDYDDHLIANDITQWDIFRFVKPECGKKIYEYLTADLYNDVLPLPGSLEAVQHARKVGKVIFVTSCVCLHAGRKFTWLNDHGFEVTQDCYVECSDKSLIAADILIDDRPENLETFKGTFKYLIDKPWNHVINGGWKRMFGLTDKSWGTELAVWQGFFKTPGTTPEDIATKAVKYDTGKPRMELLSFLVLMEVAKVMTNGAVKYADHNWRKGFNWTRPIGAALRHISKWLMGEDFDSEWNLPHLAHAICCLMFTLEHQLLEMGIDDRWKKE